MAVEQSSPVFSGDGTISCAEWLSSRQRRCWLSPFPTQISQLETRLSRERLSPLPRASPARFARRASTLPTSGEPPPPSRKPAPTRCMPPHPDQPALRLHRPPAPGGSPASLAFAPTPAGSRRNQETAPSPGLTDRWGGPAGRDRDTRFDAHFRQRHRSHSSSTPPRRAAAWSCPSLRPRRSRAPHRVELRPMRRAARPRMRCTTLRPSQSASTRRGRRWRWAPTCLTTWRILKTAPRGAVIASFRAGANQRWSRHGARRSTPRPVAAPLE